MKKLFISFAALAALVGCSEVTEQGVNVDNKQSIALSASIAVEDTRVTVEGEKFTDVKWEQGDAIKLESAVGVDAVLNATAAGDTDIRFEGEGALKSDVDTYYAVYPVQISLMVPLLSTMLCSRVTM
jgi:3D (Asp-Asp-Asp) domain-containing protein